MDIIKIARPAKASHETLSPRTKFFIIIALASLVNMVVPHNTEVKAAEPVRKANTGMVFEVGDYEEYLERVKEHALKRRTHEQVVKQLRLEMALAEKLRHYLAAQGSPLADHSHTLIKQNNWKKIIALSNAESSMCRRYPVATANCWGVGGSNLWTMGNNLEESVVSMNRFLNNYPLRSKVKYAQMSFDDMNGLYKQPAAGHWVFNNEVVYNQLTALEQSFR
jgi:hypothetical protein